MRLDWAGHAAFCKCEDPCPDGFTDLKCAQRAADTRTTHVPGTATAEERCAHFSSGKCKWDAAGAAAAFPTRTVTCGADGAWPAAPACVEATEAPTPAPAMAP